MLQSPQSKYSYKGIITENIQINKFEIFTYTDTLSPLDYYILTK